MPRKNKKRQGKGKRGKREKETPKKKKEVVVEAPVDPTDPAALFKKYNIHLGPDGYVAARATTPKSVFIDNFKMMDPGGGRALLNPTDLKITEGTKYGLVGKNGSGKTTLLKQICQYEIEQFPRHIRMLHVAQEQPRDDRLVLEAVMNADEFRVKLEQETKRMENLIAVAPDDEQEAVTATLDLLYQAAEDVSYEQGEKEAQNILDGLGFSAEQKKKRVCDLSGGWRMRVALSKALFVQPDLLLLDEPTNHLDFPTVLWLQQYLKNYEKTVIVVSHDRTFLNNVVNFVIHLHDQKLIYYKGNYNVFETMRAQKVVETQNAFQKYQVKIRDAKEFIEQFQNAGPKRQAQRKQKMEELKKLEERCPEEPKEEKKLLFTFPDIGLLEEKICEMKEISFGYTPEKPLLKNISLHLDETDKIGMIGANGVGKTTLVKLIMNELAAQNGEVTRSRHARIALFTQHHMDQLDLELSAVDFILKTFSDDEELQNDHDRVQTVRRRLGRFHITGQQQVQKMKLLSGGQKSRVAFAVATWRKPHFLIMDEPTNHLDIETIDSLIHAVRTFHGGVLLISHDQHFLRCAANEFWAVTPDKIKIFETFEGAKAFALKRMLPSFKKAKVKAVKKPVQNAPPEEEEVVPAAKEEDEEEEEQEPEKEKRRGRRREEEEDDDSEAQRRRRHRRRKERRRREEEEEEDEPERERRKGRRRRERDEEADEEEEAEEEEAEEEEAEEEEAEEEEAEEEDHHRHRRRHRRREADDDEEDDERRERRRERRRRRRGDEEEEEEEDNPRERRRRRRRDEEEDDEEEDDDERRERRRERRRRRRREEEPEEEEEERPRDRRRRRDRRNEEEEESPRDSRRRRRRRKDEDSDEPEETAI